MKTFVTVFVKCCEQSSISIALVDSGGDTCLLGPKFHIESQSTNWFIRIYGFFGAASRAKNLPLGAGFNVVDLADGVVMIKVNEGVVVPFPSILSANQKRNFVTKVDECPKKYGSRPELIINN